MPKESKIKVLLIEPSKHPRIVEIENTLEAKQKRVQGSIEAVYPYDDPVALVCNEEGKFNGMPFNRVLRDENNSIYDFVHGQFFLCGISESNFTSISDDLAKKYSQVFYHPEAIIETGKGKMLVRVTALQNDAPSKNPKNKDTDIER